MLIGHSSRSLAPMPRLERKHSLATRVFHWANVPILGVMIWSGLLIYWANDVYEIRFRGHVIFHFFPDWFYNGLEIPRRLAEGLTWHFTFMWLFALNGLLYVLYTTFSGEYGDTWCRTGTLFAEAVSSHVLHDLRRSRRRRRCLAASSTGRNGSRTRG